MGKNLGGAKSRSFMKGFLEGSIDGLMMDG